MDFYFHQGPIKASYLCEPDFNEFILINILLLITLIILFVMICQVSLLLEKLTDHLQQISVNSTKLLLRHIGQSKIIIDLLY